MLTKQDVTELKKRIKVKDCSFAKMAGVYVDEYGQKVCYMNQRFLTLEESVIYKYMNIARKLFSTKIGNNMLSVGFHDLETVTSLMDELIGTELENSVLERLYDKIIGSTDIGSYIILVWLDRYDIPRVGSDGKQQDESEEVYEYIMCAVCPVSMMAAGLEYNSEKNMIDVMDRKKVVGMPKYGFIYPAFEQRESVEDKMMVYMAHPEEPPHYILENALGLETFRTIKETQKDFELALQRGLGSKMEAESHMTYIADKILDIALEEEREFTPEDLNYCMTAAGLSETDIQNTVKEYQNIFKGNYPQSSHLVNNAIIKKIEQMQTMEVWKKKCAEAARTIEVLEGKETALCKDLKSLALRK